MDARAVAGLGRVVVLASGVLALGLGPAALAAEVLTAQEWAAQGGGAKPPLGEVAGAGILGIAIALVVVLAVVLVLAWAVKRLGVRSLMPSRGAHLEVLDRLPLAFKRQAVLIRVGDQAVLVGLGEHEVVHLATVPWTGPVPAAGAAPAPRAEDPAPAAAPAAFARLLAARSPRRPPEAP